MDDAPELPPQLTSDPPQPIRLSTDFIKSNFFRVVHADGVWGGVGPHLKIHMAFFSERRPIPQRVVYEISTDGDVGTEIAEQRVERKGLVREVEVEVLFDPDVAERIHAWLGDKIAVARKIMEEQNVKENTENAG